MKFVIRAGIVAVAVLAGPSAFAQVTTGTGDAAAQNQRSIVGVGRQTGSGGPGYRYGWGFGGGYYGDPVYNGRSVVVTPYGYMAPVESE